jgi:hypothetical protein
MKKVKINWLKKLIPGYIEIRSLYWVEHGKEMDNALEKIFYAIDTDKYDEAEVLIKKFESTFPSKEFHIGLPLNIPLYIKLYLWLIF